jgi:exodeoxyribonuclease VII small subunit
MESKEAGSLSFEERLAMLETAVRALESGEEPLERSLSIYEGAVGHLKACHELLARAEERVRILTEEGEEDFAEPAEN